MWYIFLILLFAIVCVLVVRTLLFKPQKTAEVSLQEFDFEKEKSIEALRTLVRCKTVSYKDHILEDENEFKKLIRALPKLYPNVFKTCTLKFSEDRGLLFLWEGKKRNEPTVLMAHYDVVPANEDGWDKDPFAAELENGVVWGRGTLDTKVTLNGILSAAEALIKEGFEPENDIYFAFSGNEEINGTGAEKIVDYFEQNKIEPALVLDEGGAVVEGAFPGLSKPCGLIGVAEKGILNVEFKAVSKGGHAAAPIPTTPITTLTEMCCRIQDNPFKMHITKPVKEMFNTLGRHSSFVYRMIFANLWLFNPVLNIMGRVKGGEINALLRSTIAFTKASGSAAFNVIPTEATLGANIRINSCDSIDSVLEYLKQTVDSEDIEITVIDGTEPSRISGTDCGAWDKVASAVASTWQGCLVAPYLMLQCSDSRHYGRISDKVYRFSAMALSTEERATIHGNNERIPVDTIHKSVEFYIRLMKQC